MVTVSEDICHIVNTSVQAVELYSVETNGFFLFTLYCHCMHSVDSAGNVFTLDSSLLLSLFYTVRTAATGSQMR